MKKIIIGICTHYRNEYLKICIEKINSMEIPTDSNIEIVIVDNTKESFAKNLIENLTNDYFPIHYFSFDGIGIASVRNKVLDICVSLDPDYIAFIDDDEYPCQDWLINLLNQIDNSNANIVSGPVISKFVDNNLNEINPPKHITQNPLFNLHQKRKTGKLCNSCSTNNVLFKANILKPENKFDESFNKMSGEDLDFFEKLSANGNSIIWCKEAFVTEQVPPNRSNIKYLLKRSFNNGYLKTFSKKKTKNFKSKHVFNAMLNIIIFHIILPFSYITGLTNGTKILCQCAFSWGTFCSIFNSKTYDFYI